MRHRLWPSGHGVRRSACGALAVLALGCVSARAEPPRVSVVWASGETAYLASPDSGALVVGARVTLLSDADTLAAGFVTGVLDDAIASVRLDRGTLSGVRDMRALRATIERPSLHVPSSLRVGVPAGARGNAIVACGRMTLDSVFTSQGYRMERLGLDAYRGVLDSARAPHTSWPDTLLVRTFRDATDEEIALERGELDLAVFWPGERSDRLRGDPKWRDSPVPVRSRGLLVATRVAGDPGAPAPRAADLLEAMGRGGAAAELVPLVPPGDSREPAPGGAAAGAAGFRFMADASLPGQRAIQRVLDRDAGAGSAHGSVWSLSLLDADVASADAIAAEGRVVPLLAIGCPVVCRAGLRAMLESLGAQHFADAMVCRRGERWP